MADSVTIYLSAASDLKLEREVLNRAITEVPTTLAWRILQTPLSAHEPDLKSLSEVDIHVLLLGSDVRAPVGVEWAAARRSRRLPILFLKGGIIRTQSAQAFEREIARYATWQVYTSIVDIRRRFLLLVGKHILTRYEYYNLGADEAEAITKWRNTLISSQERKVDETIGGAGDSGVILSIERYLPSDGVLLRDPNADAITHDKAEE